MSSSTFTASSSGSTGSSVFTPTAAPQVVPESNCKLCSMGKVPFINGSFRIFSEKTLLTNGKKPLRTVKLYIKNGSLIGLFVTSI